MKNILGKKWALDTNLLVYLLDKRSLYHSATVEIIKQAEKEKVGLAVAQQNLVELIQVLTDFYNLSLKSAVRQVELIMKRKIEVVSVYNHTWLNYLALCRKLKGNKRHFDLYLAATLVDNGIKTIITNDRKGFTGVKGLKVISL